MISKWEKSSRCRGDVVSQSQSQSRSAWKSTGCCVVSLPECRMSHGERRKKCAVQHKLEMLQSTFFNIKVCAGVTISLREVHVSFILKGERGKNEGEVNLLPEWPYWVSRRVDYEIRKLANYCAASHQFAREHRQSSFPSKLRNETNNYGHSIQFPDAHRRADSTFFHNSPKTTAETKTSLLHQQDEKPVSASYRTRIEKLIMKHNKTSFWSWNCARPIHPTKSTVFDNGAIKHCQVLMMCLRRPGREWEWERFNVLKKKLICVAIAFLFPAY